MENKMKNMINKPGKSGAGRLSEEALGLMDSILESWRQLDQLLQSEWKAVLKGDFTRLYRFSRGKEILSEHIEQYEKRLKDIITGGLLPTAAANKPGGNILALLLEHLEFSQRRQLMDFHVQRANLKIQVAFTNRRTMAWVRERMAFSGELLEILTGNKLRKSATYCPPDKSIVYRRTPGFEIISREPEDHERGARLGADTSTSYIDMYSSIRTDR